MYEVIVETAIYGQKTKECHDYMILGVFQVSYRNIRIITDSYNCKIPSILRGRSHIIT